MNENYKTITLNDILKEVTNNRQGILWEETRRYFPAISRETIRTRCTR